MAGIMVKYTVVALLFFGVVFLLALLPLGVGAQTSPTVTAVIPPQVLAERLVQFPIQVDNFGKILF